MMLMNNHKYKAGNKVWWVAPNTNLVIQCEITQIATKPNWTINFYDLDEPVGHSISEDELFDEPFDCEFDQKIESLDKWRESMIKFINSTYMNSGYEAPDWTWLKNKQKDEEWYLIGE